MLLAIPAEILIIIVVLALLVLGIVALVFYAAARKVSDPEGEEQVAQHGHEEGRDASNQEETN